MSGIRWFECCECKRLLPIEAGVFRKSEFGQTNSMNIVCKPCYLDNYDTGYLKDAFVERAKTLGVKRKPKEPR